jgi:thiol-disulfide isomerase/thioredoxin
MKMKAKQVYIALAVLAALGLFYYCFYGGKQISGFQSGDKFTLYYASWCPHCKDVKPVFEKWMKDNGGSVKANGKSVGLELIEESEMPAGTNVKGFPTMKLGNKEYSGARNPAAWQAWLEDNA